MAGVFVLVEVVVVGVYLATLRGKGGGKKRRKTREHSPAETPGAEVAPGPRRSDSRERPGGDESTSAVFRVKV
jgi:hypothetical protein